VFGVVVYGRSGSSHPENISSVHCGRMFVMDETFGMAKVRLQNQTSTDPILHALTEELYLLKARPFKALTSFLISSCWGVAKVELVV